MLAWLVVPTAAWSTTPWMIVLVFATMLLASSLEEGSRVLRNPLLALIPGFQGAFAPSVPSSRRFAQLLALVLRLAPVLLFLWIQSWEPVYFADARDGGDTCAALPAWLQTPCGNRKVSASSYIACQKRLPWYANSWCNARAAFVIGQGKKPAAAAAGSALLLTPPLALTLLAAS